MGELGRLTRMVKRQELKSQIRLLKSIIATHQPLVKAMEITQKAFNEGKLAGAQEMSVQIEAAEQEKLLKEAQAKHDNSNVVNTGLVTSFDYLSQSGIDAEAAV